MALYPLTGFEVGSVGRVIPGLEVKIDDNQEILLRGKTITDVLNMSVEEGVATTLWLATLPDDGPSGGFFRDRRPIPW